MKGLRSTLTDYSIYLCLLGLSLLLAGATGCQRSEFEEAKSVVREGPVEQEVQRRARGAQIIAEYRQREAAPFRKGRLRLTIDAASEPDRAYEIEVWRKQTPETTLTLTHVVKPVQERDLASLSIERAGERTVNVVYAQSTNKFIEYDSSRQLFGLTTQELLGGELEKYEFRFVREQEIDGVTTYEVEGKLKETASSPIERAVAFIRADNYQPAALHLYNALGEKMRTFQMKEYREINGQPAIWRTEIENHVRQAKLTIQMLKLTTEDKIDDTVFTREHLKKLVTQ